jgi:hypothetical protein
MPSYAQAAEFAREIRDSSPRVAFEKAWQVTWQRCERDLRELLEDDILTLIGYRVGQPDLPLKIHGPLIPHLVIDFDGDRVQFPDGTLYYGCRVYSTAVWEARSKEPGPIESATTSAGQSRNPAPESTSFRSSAEWLAWAVGPNGIRPDDNLCKRGAKKCYCQKLEAQMKVAANTNQKIKPMKSASIQARLNEDKALGWPKADDEPTTK